MLVKDRMTMNPITVSPDDSVSDAFSVLKENNIRRVPVVKNGKLVGLATEHTLHRVTPSEATTLSVFELNYLLGKMKVRDAMHTNPIYIQDTALVEEAALLMRSKDVSALPVVREGRVVGIITEDDIFDAFIDMLGARHHGARLVVRMPDEPGICADVMTIIGKYDVNIQHMVLENGRDGAEVTFRLATDDVSNIKRAIEAKGYTIAEE